MWQAEWDRRHDYTLLTLLRDGDVRGSVVIKSKDEEVAWKEALKSLLLFQKE